MLFGLHLWMTNYIRAGSPPFRCGARFSGLCMLKPPNLKDLILFLLLAFDQ